MVDKLMYELISSIVYLTEKTVEFCLYSDSELHVDI